MNMSVADITQPADKLLNLLLLPRIIYFCSVFAYDGLRYGVTLTHGGMKRGIIARIYSVFYLLAVIFNVLDIGNQIKDVLNINSINMKVALSFAASIPEIGFIFFALALVMFLFREWLIRYGQKRITSKRAIIRHVPIIRRFTNWMIALPIAIGIQNLLGLPYWIYVGIFVFFMYFSPFTSPSEIKKYAVIPEDIKTSKDKVVVMDEIS